MYNKENPIGIFDSGIGGLSVLEELIKELPNESYEYIGDTLRMPYGTRTPEEISNFTSECLDFLKKKNIKAAVLACNTATCYALENAKKIFDFPILGVVEPACEYAAEVSKNKKIALIATESTVKSGVYEQTLKQIDSQIDIRGVGAPDLVIAIENGMLHGEELENIIRRYLNELGDFEYDTLILGCTHFALATNTFKKLFKEENIEVAFVNPAKGTALNLKKILDDELLSDNKNNTNINFYATKDISHFEENVHNVIEHNGTENFIEVKF